LTARAGPLRTSMVEPVSNANAARPLLLCADDFGLSAGVNQAIAGLVRAGRLSAFSCLSNGPAWQHDAAQVAGLRGPALAGLHFNLTEGSPLSPALARHWPQLPGLPRLLIDAHLGRVPTAAVAQELAAQWAAFVQASGCQPDFIDGHQHVHHLPGVRPALLDWLQRHPVPVRSTAQVAGPADGFKRSVIMLSGGRALGRALVARGLPHNRLLLGAYDFEADYRPLMQAWLAQVPTGGALLFCHPGQASPGDVAGEAAGAVVGAAVGDLAGVAPDAIAPARLRELAYLAGPDFAQDLAAAGVVLAPAWA